jgi:hypothetical protein
MIDEEVAPNCSELPVLDCEVPKEGLQLALTLKPVEAVNGAAQYWPLFNADNPGEQFGNLCFHFGGNKGKVTLKVTLDLSAVPGRDLEFSRSRNGNLDGLVALSPDFRHQFKAKARRVNGKYTELEIRIRDKIEIPDNFAFLWFCEDVDTGMHFISGDPKIVVDPE